MLSLGKELQKTFDILIQINCISIELFMRDVCLTKEPYILDSPVDNYSRDPLLGFANYEFLYGAAAFRPASSRRLQHSL